MSSLEGLAATLTAADPDSLSWVWNRPDSDQYVDCTYNTYLGTWTLELGDSVEAAVVARLGVEDLIAIHRQLTTTLVAHAAVTKDEATTSD